MENVKLLGMGNPLLDIIADVDTAFVEQYKLKMNNAILAGKEHANIYSELSTMYTADMIPGGATLNSIRVCQALLNEPHSTAYIGSIGKDSPGNSMKTLLEKEGVCPVFSECESEDTGRCAVLVVDGERSLVTSLGAANSYKVEHLKGDVWKYVEKAEWIYSSGYFLTVCPEGMKMVSEFCSKKDKHFCLNLAAEFLVEFFKEPMMQVMQYSDYVIGNEGEFLHMSKIHKFGTEDLREIVKKVALLPGKVKTRHAICTQGADPVLVAVADLSAKTVQSSEYKVERLAREFLVDTNGAGDAFVGGFVYGQIKKKDLANSVKLGIEASRHVIQRSGCTFSFDDEDRV